MMPSRAASAAPEPARGPRRQWQSHRLPHGRRHAPLRKSRSQPGSSRTIARSAPPPRLGRGAVRFSRR